MVVVGAGVVEGMAGVDKGSPGVVKGMAVVNEGSPEVVEGFGVVGPGVVEGTCGDDVAGACVVICEAEISKLSRAFPVRCAVWCLAYPKPGLLSKLSGQGLKTSCP